MLNVTGKLSTCILAALAISIVSLLSECSATPLKAITSLSAIPNGTETVKENPTVMSSSNSTMTEAERESEYKRQFRSLHCLTRPECSEPIILEIDGQTYDIRDHICTWGTKDKDCPNLCVIVKECIGKADSKDCHECYFYCNKTIEIFSKPYGSYWIICNSTDERTTTTEQTTTTKQTTTQPPTATQQPSTTSPTPTTDPAKHIATNETRHRHSNHIHYLVNMTDIDLFAECWKRPECLGLCASLMILTFLLGAGIFLVVGAIYCSERIKSCWCRRSQSAQDARRPMDQRGVYEMVTSTQLTCPKCNYRFPEGTVGRSNAQQPNVTSGTNQPDTQHNILRTNGSSISDTSVPQPSGNESKGKKKKARKRRPCATI